MADDPKKKNTGKKTAKKTAPKKAAVRKTAAKKTAPKKTVPKKSAVKKSVPGKKAAGGKAAVNRKVKAITAGVKKRITLRERWGMIADAAYYLAEHRGFQGGDPGQDWIEAEHQIDDQLRREGTVVTD